VGAPLKPVDRYRTFQPTAPAGRSCRASERMIVPGDPLGSGDGML